MYASMRPVGHNFGSSSYGLVLRFVNRAIIGVPMYAHHGALAYVMQV